MRFRTNHATVAETGVTFVEPSQTQQHFKEECDVDNILQKYNATGFLVDPFTPKRPQQWGDFSAVTDFQTAQNQICAIQEMFSQLPSRVRAQFDNDPSKLAAFMADEKNWPAAAELGLIELPSNSNEKAPSGDSAPGAATPLPETSPDANSDA